MKLTKEQIENWRKVLVGTIGPYALVAPMEEIQTLRDKMQEKLDQRDQKFNEGFNAFDDGIEIHKNPYPINTDDHETWEDGWRSSKEMEDADNFYPGEE